MRKQKRPDPPTKEEQEIIARKHGVWLHGTRFETALLLHRNRADRTICDLPMVTCPHCGQEFQKDDYYDVKIDDEWECPMCEHPIYVELVDTRIFVTLTNKKPDWE